MQSYRDPCTEHIDSIRDWTEFLDVLDAWDDLTSRYWDTDPAPQVYSHSGRYAWWAKILASWILDKSNVSPEPLLEITRMIQAKDSLGSMTSFRVTPEEIERCRQRWRPYRQILIDQALGAATETYDPVNAERDKWLYEQWQHKLKTWLAILSEFKQVRADKGWRVVSSVNGIKLAAQKYATFHHLPFRKDTAGRRKRAK